jgi:hypothetical protein
MSMCCKKEAASCFRERAGMVAEKWVEPPYAHLVTTVVTSAGKTLGVLVGQHGTVGLHDSERSQVLFAHKEKEKKRKTHTQRRESAYEFREQPASIQCDTDLGSDQLETGKLPPGLILDDLGDLRVSLVDVLVEALVLAAGERWNVTSV